MSESEGTTVTSLSDKSTSTQFKSSAPDPDASSDDDSPALSSCSSYSYNRADFPLENEIEEFRAPSFISCNTNTSASRTSVSIFASSSETIQVRNSRRKELEDKMNLLYRLIGLLDRHSYRNHLMVLNARQSLEKAQKLQQSTFFRRIFSISSLKDILAQVDHDIQKVSGLLHLQESTDDLFEQKPGGGISVDEWLQEAIMTNENASNNEAGTAVFTLPRKGEETEVPTPGVVGAKEKVDMPHENLVGIRDGVRLSGGIPRVVEAEQVAAGWPEWLSAVAGEAIKGWVPRQSTSFQKLNRIQTGFPSVYLYKGRDMITGKLVTLKKFRFGGLCPAREILVLRRLDHPSVVKLEGLITSKMSHTLYLIFEYIEHDLEVLNSVPGPGFTEEEVKCYMQQLLRGLDYCHSRGVLHRDIRGSNLLINENGILKIAGFSWATFLDADRAQILTSRVGNHWYRPPEHLLGATSYGVSVDLWSTGCLLAELYAGRPILPGRTEVEQLHKIFKLCGSPSEEFWRKYQEGIPHATIFKPQQPYERVIVKVFKDFPSSALALLDVLLSLDPTDRGTAASALKSEYFATQPLPCHP